MGLARNTKDGFSTEYQGWGEHGVPVSILRSFVLKIWSQRDPPDLGTWEGSGVEHMKLRATDDCLDDEEYHIIHYR